MLGETIGSININSTGYLISRTRQQVDGNVTTTITDYPHTVITHIHLISNAGGGSVLTINNGQTGTQQINLTGTTSKGMDFDFGIWGIDFPEGAYITVDGNIQSATIVCKSNLS